jgi:hypothetical protein
MFGRGLLSQRRSVSRPHFSFVRFCPEIAKVKEIQHSVESHGIFIAQSSTSLVSAD